MEETKVRIGEEVLLDIGTHSEWYISSLGYDGESVDITLRRKADRDKDWWLVDPPQTEAPKRMRTFSEGGIGYTPQTDWQKMTEEEIDTMLARVLVSGQTDCGWK